MPFQCPTKLYYSTLTAIFSDFPPYSNPAPLTVHFFDIKLLPTCISLPKNTFHRHFLSKMEESPKVQHVTKASSDQLLRKFAQAGSGDAAAKELRLVKRRKKSRRSREVHYCESPSNGGSGVVEKRSLLPPAARRSAALLLQLGAGGSQLRVRDLRNKSLLGAIEKTWRRTIKRASKMLIERHYNQHKRLINEAM